VVRPFLGLRRPHASVHVAVVPGEEPVLRLIVEAHESVLEHGRPVLPGQPQAGIGVQLLEIALRQLVFDPGPGDRVRVAEQTEPLEEAVVLAGLGRSKGLSRDLRLDAAEGVEVDLRDDLPAADHAVHGVVAAPVAHWLHRSWLRGPGQLPSERTTPSPSARSRSCSPSSPQCGNELFPAEQARIIQLLVERVDVQEDALEVRIRAEGLASLVGELRQQGERMAA
jgi:hypothetical protein